MSEIRNLTRNGETFYPLTCTDAVVDRDGNPVEIINDIFDISEYNASGTPPVLAKYASLSLALAAVPETKRKGGMTIRYVQSSDNKYVQFRLMKDEWSTDTNDWAIAEENILIENNEYIKAECDAAGHLLFWIRKDASVDWAVGVPTPIKIYVDSKVAEIWNGNEGSDIDGLNKVISFLDGFATSNTLAALLNGKVDKVEGKSLIDEGVAGIVSTIVNTEYLNVEADEEGKIFGGRKSNGNKVENMPIEMPSSTIKSISLPGWIEAYVDKDGKIFKGIREDGTTFVLSNKNEQLPLVSLKKYFVLGKMLNQANIGDTIDITDIQPNYEGSVGMYLINACKKDDIYIVNAIGSGSWRTISFVDNNYKLLYQSPYSHTAINERVVASSDGYIIVNSYYNGYKFDVQKHTTETPKVVWPVNGYPIPSTYTPTAGSWQSMEENSGSPLTKASTVSEIYALYDALVETYPSYITKHDLGMDASNTYHIYNYVFEPEHIRLYYDVKQPTPPKRFLIMGGIHGDGYKGDSNVMKGVLYYFLKDICENYKENPTLEYLRWNIVFDVIPLINPWGHANNSRTNSNGVDLNRNSFTGWSKSSPTIVEDNVEIPNPQYSGPYTMSEAESIVWFNWVNAHRDAAWFFDVHSVGNPSSQNGMMYGEGEPDSNWFHIFQSVVRKVGNIWNGMEIPGLSTDSLHGSYVDPSSLGSHVNNAVKTMGINAGLFEGFPNFQNSQVNSYSSDIIHMLQIYMGYCFLYTSTYLTQSK